MSMMAVILHKSRRNPSSLQYADLAFAMAGTGGKAWSGRKESGKENPYSCVVLAGARSTAERQEALQVWALRCLLICTRPATQGCHPDRHHQG